MNNKSNSTLFAERLSSGNIEFPDLAYIEPPQHASKITRASRSKSAYSTINPQVLSSTNPPPLTKSSIPKKRQTKASKNPQLLKSQQQLDPPNYNSFDLPLTQNPQSLKRSAQDTYEPSISDSDHPSDFPQQHRLYQENTFPYPENNIPVDSFNMEPPFSTFNPHLDSLTGSYISESILENDVNYDKALIHANPDPTIGNPGIKDDLIQAYAKLEGSSINYFIQKLSVTLGRHSEGPEAADIVLGESKALSRKHARIFYNFLSQNFELEVYGKNGCFVDGFFIQRNTIIPLHHKTYILMGEANFYFLLPRSTPSPKEPSADELPANEHYSRNSSGSSETLAANEAHKVSTAFIPNLKYAAGIPGHDMVRILPSTARPLSMKTPKVYAKPLLSYASLIAQAINSTDEKKITLNGIYNFIMANFPYYREAQNGWQNSIRHNLSLNKAFEKVSRDPNQPGKGAFWKIKDQYKHQFENGVYKRMRRSSKKSRTSNESAVLSPDSSIDTLVTNKDDPENHSPALSDNSQN
ncbi:hypothetical protein BB560_006064 [Smittium megazygosporum]|uniref:Fork-head domain-containing protein n=1 Tax=Smittium megazygosporum TaxID=133381 RepID=A0A2T9YJ39_9FUNG|nr:hypothetical protein BB560_006064 [Smittium megazygosporum]